MVGILRGTASMQLSPLLWQSYWLRHSIILGTIPGAIISACSNDILGRKLSMLLLSLTAMLSFFFLHFANNISMAYITLILMGVSYAWALSVIPIYVSETASPYLRGPAIVFDIICMPIGTYLSYVFLENIQIPMEFLPTIGVVSLVPIIILVTFLNESPYFLIMKNQDEKCKQVLRKIRSGENIEREYDDIKTAWNETHKEKSNLRGFFISLGVLSVQQFSGYILVDSTISIVLITHPKYFSLLKHLREFQLILIGAGLLSIFAVNLCGRKLLFKIVTIGACLGNFLVGFGFLMEENKGLSDSLGTWELIGSFIYLATIGFGLIHLPHVLSVELLPMDIKSKGCSLLIAIAAIEGIIIEEILKAFLKHGNTVYPTYIILFVCSVLGLFFGKVPETKMKSLPEIQKQLKYN
ncbi:sugar transporter ERD6-like 1 isoform X2 [Chrysoperla carnea]|nr:sugar transporter ERD6-like 1 isoform X2 [Chrysoperla carnea]